MSGVKLQDHAAQAAARNAPQRKTTPATAASGREANGRFARGNPGGPGNPFARRTAAARKAFCEAVSHEDLVAIARSMTEKARGGDVAAAKLVLCYVVGKPADVIEPDTLDLREFQQYEEEVRHYGSLPSVAATPDLGLACTIARTSRPGIAETAARDLGKALVEGDFPEDSPFAIDEDFECQEVPGSDTVPSPIGDNGSPERPQAPLLPNPETPPPAPTVAGELPGRPPVEPAPGSKGEEVFVPLAELAKLLPPETVVRLTLAGEQPSATGERPLARPVGTVPGPAPLPNGENRS
jgi:hypothetical protein